VTTPAAPAPGRGERPAARPWWLWWREPDTWRGGLALMVLLLALLWVIEILDLASGHRLRSLGLRPRQADGLIGVLTCPFLHAGIAHLLSNSIPFVLLGWFVLFSGFERWLLVTVFVVVVGGLATWAIAPSGLVVGASGLVMGWLGYLIAWAVFSRRLVAIIAALVALIYFGSLLGGLLPTVRHDISWQGHICGFAAGLLVAWLLDLQRRRALDRPPPSQSGSITP
jgi:membrane associated rhomboid family serine protease